MRSWKWASVEAPSEPMGQPRKPRAAQRSEGKAGISIPP